jgi:hypothetical protein
MIENSKQINFKNQLTLNPFPYLIDFFSNLLIFSLLLKEDKSKTLKQV